MARRGARIAALVVMLVCGSVGLSARDVRAASSAQEAIASDSDALLKSANEAGFKDLSDCERNLLQSAPFGEYANCQSYDDKENDPSKGDQWPESRQIRAKLIRWLCVDEAARKLIDPKGIEIYGAKVVDPLDLDFISVPFLIAMVKSRILSPISLIDGNIEALYLMGTWTGPIAADGLKTRGSIFLSDGFRANSEVRLVGVTIGGLLNCENGTFSNPNGAALSADRIKVTAAVFLREGFTATGEVRLLGATVGGNLDCDKGTFSNPNGYALNADNINVTGNVFLRQGFKATGEVRLPLATVGGDLECKDAIFTPGSRLIAEGARVSGKLWWTAITDGSKSTKPNHKNPDVMLDLLGASAASVVDDKDSWPTVGNLGLNGFTYDRFEMSTDNGAVVPRDAGSRLEWLRLQNRSGGLATQNYQQLAKVLESEGDERGARHVRIAMEDDLLPSLSWVGYLWRQVLRGTVAYGYKPWRALYWACGRAVVLLANKKYDFSGFLVGQFNRLLIRRIGKLFTGIIEDLGSVASIKHTDGGVVIAIRTALPLARITIGESIAVNGCCLTVTRKGRGTFSADVSAESLRRTALGVLKPGDRVNLERCLTLEKLLGGHMVSGHVDGVGRIVSIEPEGDSRLYTFEVGALLARYLIEKGSVAIDGISLTVFEIRRRGSAGRAGRAGPAPALAERSGEARPPAAFTFKVALIPHTLAVTTLGFKRSGERVNIESDLLVKYVERIAAPYLSGLNGRRGAKTGIAAAARAAAGGVPS